MELVWEVISSVGSRPSLLIINDLSKTHFVTAIAIYL